MELTSAGQAGVAPPVPRHGSILIVEDRDDVRQGMAQLLELHGFLVEDASSGEEALAQMREDAGDLALLLLDLQLGEGVSGLELRARQLADPKLALVPTVVITATELRGDQREAMRTEDWLEKPFRFEQLLAIVRRYVSPGLA